MAALNTVITGGEIHAGNYGAHPNGTILEAGSKLSVVAGLNSTVRVVNVGKVSRPANASDTTTSIASTESAEFGPFPGPRHFLFAVSGAGQGSYSISRDE